MGFFFLSVLKSKKRKDKIKMKKKISLLLSVILALTLIFTACAKVDPNGYATVVVAADGDNIKEYSVPLSKVNGENGAFGLLDYLKAEGELDYEAEDSAYGKYLNSVGEVKNDALAGKYIYIWTSVESDFDVSEYKSTIDYKGVSLTSAGVGISAMSVPDRAIIYIGYYPG